ncbi:MAG: hypothetical protein WB579_02380 [Bryobacteraceae bacterium]
MKNKAKVTAAFAATLLWAAPPAAAQDTKPLRIGVFDSRAIALAYGNSDEFQRTTQGLRSDYNDARAANNDTRAKELNKEGQWLQVRLHQQVFSTGPVSGILAKVADKLPAVAAQAGVALIVSKWELQFKGPGVELVDVTLPIVRLFNPSNKVLQWIEEMKTQAPVPFEKLPLDPNM